MSKKKAYTLIESGVLETMKPGTITCLHPFMEGNGRSTRIWLDLILKKVDKSLQRLTEEREGKDQGSDLI